MFKKADILLISMVLFLFVVSLVCIFAFRQHGSIVCIEKDGVEIERFSLSKDSIHKIEGCSNIVIVKDQMVWIEDADCPDKLCEKMGKIRFGGQSLICLPNKLTVTIKSSDGVDFVI